MVHSAERIMVLLTMLILIGHMAAVPAIADTISDTLTVFNGAGQQVGQVTATEDQETANGAEFLYIINQDWADPMQQGFFTTLLLEPGRRGVSDVFGVTNGAVAGCQFQNGCLFFVSDAETTFPNLGGGTIVDEGNGVFLATKYLSPALRVQGWTAEFVSDIEVTSPEPSTWLLLGAGLIGLLGYRWRQSKESA